MFHRSARSVREIIPLDKWELLPRQIEYGEELGRGAFGVVYKASLKRRVGIEVFDTEKILKPEEPCQVVAVKVLQGNRSDHANSFVRKHTFLQGLLSLFDDLQGLDAFQTRRPGSIAERLLTVMP